MQCTYYTYIRVGIYPASLQWPLTLVKFNLKINKIYIIIYPAQVEMSKKRRSDRRSLSDSRQKSWILQSDPISTKGRNMLIDLAKDLLRILRVELPENGNNCQLSETTLVAEEDTELKTKQYNIHIIYIL